MKKIILPILLINFINLQPLIAMEEYYGPSCSYEQDEQDITMGDCDKPHYSYLTARTIQRSNSIETLPSAIPEKEESPLNLSSYENTEDLEKKYQLIKLAHQYLSERDLDSFSTMLSDQELSQNMFNNFLVIADGSRCLPAIHLLIQKHKARGNFFDQWKNHALHIAVVENDKTVLTEKIDQQTVNERVNNKTPLSLAAAYNKADIVEILAPYAHQENLNESLQLAIHYDSQDVLTPLLINGADVNAQSLWGETPLYIAACHGKNKSIQFLINHGADVTIATKEGSTPLHQAVVSCNLITIKTFISQGADVNAQTTKGITPLLAACDNNRNEVATILINNNAHINVHDIYQETPLHKAAEKGNTFLVKLLIDNGAHVDARDARGRTPLDIAQEIGFTDVAIELEQTISAKKQAEKKQKSSCCLIQ